MFTEQQLEHIKAIARKKKNQGELSVFHALDEDNNFSNGQIDIIGFCAAECKRQRSGEMSVYDMINAWDYAYRKSSNPRTIDLYFIEKIGQLVEPIDNKDGFRTIPIGVTDGKGGWIEKAYWRDVPYKLETLLDSYYHGYLDHEIAEALAKDFWPIAVPNHPLAKSAEDQFYFEYEEIHPFVDGNGRSGKILYNYLLGRLANPIMPPNFFGGSNP